MLQEASVRDYKFTTQQFNLVRERLYSSAGIALADHKQDMVYNRLIRRLRCLNLNSFEAYFEYLQDNESEQTFFINALTTNLTSFFREKHHFDFIRDQIVPERLHGHDRKLRFWSAGCSMGEEAYSLAMTLCNAGISPASWDLKILATDIDSAVLQTARQGIYDLNRSNISRSDLQKWFLKGRGKQEGLIRIKSTLQELISFRQLNLMDEWPIKSSFDAIFCRNVMIYFDAPTQKILLDRMAKMLKPGGYLFVGHSEALVRQQQMFELIGRTIYRKVGS
ncbi:CheR family methyltransferase [Amphritea balenae]|uniref:Chemotaxis protein methyltransferase n=1 Tax=Amphritea balenae TaxID=452629 RepID=A0A3P1SNA9_9GAMM|nr:protein-glutamate O-methyltransferase CheR [Amphritea balenae]RRC98479.1 protein-glutamate O-methyltransferase CheR [Amphritea balenae]GGK64817.1 chemotaxis protein methyltransferase 2 [Amphritea balenae]